MKLENQHFKYSELIRHRITDLQSWLIPEGKDRVTWRRGRKLSFDKTIPCLKVQLFAVLLLQYVVQELLLLCFFAA